MEASRNSWITAVVFEHACKQDFNGVIKNVLEDKDLLSKLQESSETAQSKHVDETKIKPVFMFLHLLKKVHDHILENDWSGETPGIIIGLLESTFMQFNFISMRKLFPLISEFKLLDLLNIIVANSGSTHVVNKLNQHFPHWTRNYRSSLKERFSIKNPALLDKLEESHTQCRRLILKLAVDKTFKSKYIAEQYSNDIKKLTKESKAYLMEIISALESHAGCSVLEKMANGENVSQSSDDLAVQLLLDYIQPTITDEVLLRYLDDLEPTLSSQPTSSLTKCLLPFDTMSEMSDDDSDESLCDCESSQDTDCLTSFGDILPSDSPVHMDEEDV